MISFATSKEEIAIDDLMSLTVSDAEKWFCSSEEPEALPPSQSARPSTDSKLIRVLSKPVKDLGLEWSAPEELHKGLLDE